MEFGTVVGKKKEKEKKDNSQLRLILLLNYTKEIGPVPFDWELCRLSEYESDFSNRSNLLIKNRTNFEIKNGNTIFDFFE